MSDVRLVRSTDFTLLRLRLERLQERARYYEEYPKNRDEFLAVIESLQEYVKYATQLPEAPIPREEFFCGV